MDWNQFLSQPAIKGENILLFPHLRSQFFCFAHCWIHLKYAWKTFVLVVFLQENFYTNWLLLNAFAVLCTRSAGRLEWFGGSSDARWLGQRFSWLCSKLLMYVLISRSSHGLSNLKPNYVTEGKKQMFFCWWRVGTFSYGKNKISWKCKLELIFWKKKHGHKFWFKLQLC